MELEYPDGSKTPITADPPTVLGRSLTTADPTISRRHLSLRLLNPTIPTASFEVTGKNPVLVRTADGGNRVYRASEKGELSPGDCVSLSIKNPCFFTVNTKEGEDASVDRTVLDAVERRERRTRERLKEQEVDTGVSDIELNSLDIDVSQIDPVKEFGFLVIGQEFDSYPERKIRHVTKWNWFLEEKKGEVDDDEDDDDEDVGKASSSKGKGRGRGRRKMRGGDDDDEVWTGECEDEKELAARAGRNKRPKYSTRSKDPKKPCLDDRKALSQKGANVGEDEFEEEDEDETLGGFIINDDEECVEDEEELEVEEEEDELKDEEELDED